MKSFHGLIDSLLTAFLLEHPQLDPIELYKTILEVLSDKDALSKLNLDDMSKDEKNELINSASDYVKQYILKDN